MSRLAKVFSVAVLTVGFATGAEAASYSFSTFDNQINPSIPNQGWWDASNQSEPGLSGNAITGSIEAEDEWRSYFTFDLSGFTLAANEVITSLTFAGNANDVKVAGGDFETLGLFDVSTSTAVLHEVNGLTAGVFADLGTGNSYGSRDFFLSDDGSDFEMALNGTAVTDVLAAQGGYFSIGGALLTLDALDFDYVFGGSTLSPFSLNIETQISAVPLPAALPLYGAGLAVMGFIGWRKHRKSAAA